MSFLSSLQGKLILASVAMVLVALAVAGFVFVMVNRDDERDRKLERMAANASDIQREFLIAQLRGDTTQELTQFVHDAADHYDVQVLMLDRSQRIIADSEGDLEDQHLDLLGSLRAGEPVTADSPYVAVEPEGSAADLVVVVDPDFGSGSRIEIRGGNPLALRYSLVLAVPKETLANAWLELLPTLAVAGGIAIPVAVLLAVLIALYITRPLEKLTGASLDMASGRYDVDVAVDRSDEVGRLSRAFQTMAARVGDAQTKMRTLVANVSHDMKTPLTSIIGFSKVLKEEPAIDKEEVQRMAGIIHEEAQRLSSRLTDLLYLSELESGQIVLQRDVIDLPALLRGVLVRVKDEAERRGLTLSADLSPAEVTTDGQKLERAIENLVDNARKFTPDGGRIVVRNGSGAGTAWIEISNDVDGLEAEELPRLFERFYRRDRTRAGADGHRAGSGLGLPIARDLTALLGGTLEARIDQGVLTLRIELPAEPPASSSRSP